MDLTLLNTITPDTSLTFTATVVIAGIGVVIGMLILLIIIFKVFGLVVVKAEGKSKNNAADATPAPVMPAPRASAVAPTSTGISGEIVAAISAAIYALEGENAQICSITPAAATVGVPAPMVKSSPLKVRNPWAQAAIADNTRAF